MQTYLNQKQLLDLLQVSNTNFPTGSFSHSFGLETYIRENIIDNAHALEKWINIYLFDNFTNMDLLAIKQLYEYYDSNKIEKIYELDQIISSSGMSKETRNGVVRIATQMLKIYLELFEDKQILIDYQQKIKSKQCKGHPAIVFGILCCILKINLKDCLFTYMYSSITNLVQNCIRAIPLGQIEGQKSMYKIKQSFESVYEKLMTLDFEHNFCKNFPGFEIKQMNHEIIHVRLFMS